MKKVFFTLLALFFSHFSFSQSKKLLFSTEFGNFKVVLYDFTPKHRDLIVSAIQDSVYQGALFNRIIENFVVQGGEHDIDIARREKADITGQKPRLLPEFDDRAFHKIGALGAGRDDNRSKASFLNQIYFVVGKKVTEEDLDALELKKNIKYTKKQRDFYLKYGGLPRLDKDYTVFGEIVEGLDVILTISKQKTASNDYPIKKIVFSIQEV